MLLRELFSNVREAVPAVGRKYQHIEDLVFTNGSDGGLHAVERLRHMITQGGTIELKWDGSPVVYWGKDENGRFSLIPKNAWEYLKRGKRELDNGVSTIMYAPSDIEKFITGTGKADPSKEAERKQFAGDMAKLWPYFEKISPQRGYIEGGLLFYPGKPAVLNPKTGNYDFTPNITSFHIPTDSELGARIKKAKVMVAATGYYATLGSSEESRYPEAEKLGTDDVIVQGTHYVEHPPQVESTGLDKAEKYIESNAQKIDGFLAPKPGLSKPGEILYKFFNQNLRIEGVKKKFTDWAKQNLSDTQAAKVTGDPGLDTILTAVELLTAEKMKVIDALSKMSHGSISQTRPEGYVQAHPGKKFKYDIPGQFVKAIDQKNWVPRKD
jgi:Family of unknown function (DUF6267)